MAPDTESTRRFLNDDFIPTISDDEASIPDLDEDEDEMPNGGGLAAHDGTSLKRKREEEVPTQKSRKSKKKRKQEVQDTSADQEEDDGDFDPGFSFSLDTLEQGLLQQVQGWGDEGAAANGLAQGSRGISID